MSRSCSLILIFNAITYKKCYPEQFLRESNILEFNIFIRCVRYCIINIVLFCHRKMS